MSAPAMLIERTHWWSALTAKGDPARRPHLTDEAFAAGFDAALRLVAAGELVAKGLDEPTEHALDAGQHALSEWLDDAAPLHERRYREPARSAWKAMLDAMRGAPAPLGPPMYRGPE